MNDIHKSKTEPKADGRWRVTRSEKLWVVRKVKEIGKTEIIGYGVIFSIERSVYTLNGKESEWVRYQNHFYPLHAPKDFKKILESSKKLSYGFFNNESGYSDNPLEQTIPAYFIYLDEEGPYAL